MNKVLLIIWLLVPVAAGAYHFGPGQKRMTLDEVSRLIAQAEEHVESAGAIAAAEGDAAARGEWAAAEATFSEALSLIPPEKEREIRALRLERAKAGMYVSKLIEANTELENLADEMLDDASADPALLSEVRSALANSQYYLTWLRRLEGAPRPEWEPEIEASRQTYKLLAEEALAANDTEALSKNQENLESAIRLARMDLTELQGLPIPSQ